MNSFDAKFRNYNPALPNTAGTGQWAEGDPFTNVVIDGTYCMSTPMMNYFAFIVMSTAQLLGSDQRNGALVWPVRGGQ